jgi:hypothetical protein
MGRLALATDYAFAILLGITAPAATQTLGAAGPQAGEQDEGDTIRVAIEIGADDHDRAVVTACIDRELRALPDVEIIEPSDSERHFQVTILEHAAKTRSPGGGGAKPTSEYVMSYSVSETVGRARAETLVTDQFNGREDFVDWFASQLSPSSQAMAWDAKLDELCRKVVADINIGEFETTRHIYRSARHQGASPAK